LFNQYSFNKTNNMSITKFLVGGIVGGIILFLLGYLFYGVLFASYLESVSTTQAPAVMRPMEFMYFPGLIVGNLLSGFLLAFVLLKAKSATLVSGLITGAVLGFLVSASIDFTIYGTTYMFKLKGIMADVAISTAMMAIAGAVVAPITAKMK
jgi:hypothetical protein